MMLLVPAAAAFSHGHSFAQGPRVHARHVGTRMLDESAQIAALQQQVEMMRLQLEISELRAQGATAPATAQSVPEAVQSVPEVVQSVPEVAAAAGRPQGTQARSALLRAHRHRL